MKTVEEQFEAWNRIDTLLSKWHQSGRPETGPLRRELLEATEEFRRMGPIAIPPDLR